MVLLRRVPLFALVLPLLWMAAHPARAAAPELSISNQTSQDLLNIRFHSGLKIFFLRLDMAPGQRDEVENPGGVADMRVDTGLEFWSFRDVPLGDARRMTFCGDHAACMILESRDGISRHVRGEVRELVPQPGSRPVCELDQFRPGMTMSDVCSLLRPDVPRDDNDALLEGLGFAGQLWAARLIPGGATAAGEDVKSLGHEYLEHLELRRPLEKAALEQLLAELYARGLTPWQAEFPGLDMDFAEMPDLSVEKKRELLDQTLQRFLAQGRGEASFMLAPAAELPALADGDEPRTDVQIFTLTLRPASGVLLLDLAAYRGNGGGAPRKKG
ncbi:peptidoglycan glycosyltransferase [Desulfovibrio sp.]|uniref:peptidoglycan glycosyltransferase n=1 Tax=Desulfovibrio sp. TaxID=885 RepID=UPI0023CF4E74|nr:peptidoglycan glycosyltransferase [Desulfovibrio sp.]MDE7241109.1 peptidoglycan glycosyltransferase [Desulfovibrio sp.]